MIDLLKSIEKPTLVVQKQRVCNNIKRIAEKARRSGVRFRPHFKTHQSAQIGEWFHNCGVSAITVSSVDMALYFAENGWSDITIAFPVNVRQINDINALAESITMHLLVESPETVYTAGQLLRFPVKVWIKIDTGYRRTGIDYTDYESVLQIAAAIVKSNKLTLQGILTHAGHSYSLRNRRDIVHLYIEQVERMKSVKTVLADAGFTGIELSIGDTPCCSVVGRFDGVDEVRPGNFVFYDITQLAIGSCNEDEIAIACACPVVAKHRERWEIIIYGGAVHLSKDVLILSEGTKCYGRIALPQNSGWGRILPNTYVMALSQEHGIIKTDETTFEKVLVGDIVYVIPVHSCLAADLHRRYMTTEGDTIEAGKY